MYVREEEEDAEGPRLPIGHLGRAHQFRLSSNLGAMPHENIFFVGEENAAV